MMMGFRMSGTRKAASVRNGPVRHIAFSLYKDQTDMTSLVF